MSSSTLTAEEKSRLKSAAEGHISQIQSELETKVDRYTAKITEKREAIPQFESFDIFSLDPDSVEMEILVAKIKMYDEMVAEAKTIQNSPYFLRLDITWTDGSAESLYISKFYSKEHNIFSWISPISTLRYAEIGPASYEKPTGESRGGEVTRKDNYLITGGDIVFMTYQDQKYPRQVVFQKHFAERRDFLLPEIVAELDKIQDEIIRSNPRGEFLISGPAGSGKTTLALHRIAYLVLTPEFQDFFDPERIVVFVSNENDIKYFTKLLPELGINGVRITTFMEWGTMIINSRFRAKLNQRFNQLDVQAAEEFITKHNPYVHVHPRQVLDEYRRIKQQMVMAVRVNEGSQKDVYPALHDLYTTGLSNFDTKLAAGFRGYLEFQKKHKYLDEVDLTILLMSLENPIAPFVHVVVDEVQNWFPEQLKLIGTLVHNGYRSLTYIGDIRQKTKAFTINEWAEINPEFELSGPRKYELLKVYRNTKQILEYLLSKGYAVEVADQMRSGEPVVELTVTDLSAEVARVIAETEQKFPGEQIAVIGRYRSSLEGLQNLNYDKEHVHVMTADAAQGLEFHTVIIVGAAEFASDQSFVREHIGIYSANEYEDQNRHLFYVAATRAREGLIIVS